MPLENKVQGPSERALKALLKELRSSSDPSIEHLESPLEKSLRETLNESPGPAEESKKELHSSVEESSKEYEEYLRAGHTAPASILAAYDRIIMSKTFYYLSGVDAKLALLKVLSVDSMTARTLAMKLEQNRIRLKEASEAFLLLDDLVCEGLIQRTPSATDSYSITPSGRAFALQTAPQPKFSDLFAVLPVPS